MAYSEELWAEAKRKCRLNADDIARAKRLGLNQRSLIKNIPNKNEQWKAPVRDWLIDIENKRLKKSEKKKARRQKEDELLAERLAKPLEEPEPEQADDFDYRDIF